MKRIIPFSVLLLLYMFLLGIVGVGHAQIASTSSYQPSAEEIERYGPGFPAYCSAYSTRPECAVIYGNPIPIEPDPCYITGGYQPGCVPVQQYPCLPGDPSPNCLPSYPPPVIYPQPYPIPTPQPIPPPIICGDGYYHPACYPQPYPIPVPPPYIPVPQPPYIPPPPPYIPPPPPPSVYDFRHPTPPPVPGCQYGFSPHCLLIAPLKVFHHSYAINPTIPTYRLGERLEYRVNSPYSGYLYVFVTESDGTMKALYPNAYTGEAIYINAGTVIDLPGQGAKYSLDISAPYGVHILSFVVTTNPLPQYAVDRISYPQDLDNVLLDAGLSQGTYHGQAETVFEVVY